MGFSLQMIDRQGREGIDYLSVNIHAMAEVRRALVRAGVADPDTLLALEVNEGRRLSSERCAELAAALGTLPDTWGLATFLRDCARQGGARIW